MRWSSSGGRPRLHAVGSRGDRLGEAPIELQRAGADLTALSDEELERIIDTSEVIELSSICRLPGEWTSAVT
jgi:hypothetical protein